MFWEFGVPAGVETCEEQAAEMVARCETLFETFEDFLAPTEINYAIGRFLPDQRLPVDVRMDEYRGAAKRELRNETEISVEDFRDSARVDGPGARWISVVNFDGTKVRVRLADGDTTASRRKNTVKYRKGKPVEDDPTRDPLELSVLHTPNTQHSEIDTEYVTSLIVAPMSDIWFEESDIGVTNRRYLADFLERIEAVFPVAEVERTSEWLPISDLEAVY